ncbi:hypothetical protein HHK36_023252 [Tetracentron sinense]|uniref:Germin-like protein n=1 Tax=Tetracentron sinense TaxID=13715 RepID=A0A834YS13_TETSI|nr:hypothetical protein HHK36_023252 [Tetracentron sinense]
MIAIVCEWEIPQGPQACYGKRFAGLNKHSKPTWIKCHSSKCSQIAGLNTLGISVVRIDYAPNGVIPPHTHPQATEILSVLEGTLSVGFVTSVPDNRLITKVLNKGDVFVFPIGLIHFQFNVGNTNAVAIAALSSQNPGIIIIANAVFGRSHSSLMMFSSRPSKLIRRWLTIFKLISGWTTPTRKNTNTAAPCKTP